MKLAHNIKLSVFSYESDGEDTDKLASTLASIVPFDLEDEKLKIDRTSAKGFQERKIMILELTLTKESHTNKFLNYLKENLKPEHMNLIKSQLESRLDDELNFFIRLDKDKLLNNKEFYLTESGNCFHIKMSVAAYPAKSEKALEILKDWLSK